MVYTTYLPRLLPIIWSMLTIFGLLTSILESSYIQLGLFSLSALFTSVLFFIRIEMQFTDEQFSYTSYIYKFVTYKTLLEPSQIKQIDFRAPLLTMRQIIIKLENQKHLYIWNTEPAQFYKDIDQYCVAHNISTYKSNEYTVLK